MLNSANPLEHLAEDGLVVLERASQIARQCARIADGKVLLPREADWQKVFLDEFRAFPHGKHDDQVDSVSQYLNSRVDRASYGFRCYRQ